MTDSPRPETEESRTTRSSFGTSPAGVIVLTVLDTTWRMFVPILAGLFIGIGLDKLFNIVPIATIVCLIAGVAVTAFLVSRQFRKVNTTVKTVKKAKE